MRVLALTKAIAATFLIAVMPAVAQEPPAVAAASGAEKARLTDLIAKAKTEGSVSNIETIMQPPTTDAMAAAFRTKYGLPASFKVNSISMAPGQLITRLQQELQAGKLTFDTGAISSIPWVMARVKEGKIAKYDSPEYAAYRKPIDMGLAQDGHFAFTGGYYFVPMWNTETLKFDGKSYKDVLTIPDIAGRLSGSDPSVSDPPLMTYMGLRTIFPVSYFEEIAKLKYNFLYKSEQVAQRLVTGEDLLALSGMPTRAHQANARGAKIKFMDPEEGIVLLTQSFFVLEAAPRPAAARLWFDFVLSEEGQKILGEKEYTISGRANFKSPVPDHVPTLDQLKPIKIDWTKVTEADMQKSRDEWKTIFKK